MDDEIKNSGQYFTPEMVADFMVNLTRKPESAKILEPCAGEGVFLNALLKKKYNNLKAFELDASLNNKSPVNIEHADFLTIDWDEKFDVIIGNPPYVRWKNISKNTQEMLKTDPRWSDKLNGLADILYPFIYASVEKLNKNGELIFITPLFWTSTSHSRLLRKYLSSIGSLELFITFNEMNIFKEVSSSILIFKFIKEKTNRPIKVINVNSKKKLTADILTKVEKYIDRLDHESEIQEEFYEAYLHPQFINSNPWSPLPPKIEPIINQIEKSCTENSPIVEVSNQKTETIRLSKLLEESDLNELDIGTKICNTVRFSGKKYYILDSKSKKLTDFFETDLNNSIIERYVRLGDIADIGNGMVSGLDEAFQVDNLNKYNDIERKNFVKVIKAKNLDKYFAKGHTDYIFINHLPNEDDLEKLPEIKRKLMCFKIDLDKRYSYKRNIPYWHWVFPRNQNLIEKSLNKIIVPCKERIDGRGYARFALVEGFYYATQDTTVIVKKTEFKEDVKYLLAVLNSDLILTWMKHKGLKRGGVLEFSEKPLSMIPIRLINWDNPDEVNIHNEIVKLIDLIIQSHEYKLTSEKIEVLLKKLYGL